jgi:putative two-component system response regulator
MNVLVVDDDPGALELIAGALGEAGQSVFTASNGREAMEILREGTCRVVISDWEMPEMDGLELCRAIRSGEFGRYIFVILLTAKEGTGHLVAGLSAGADEFMSKPFEPEELAIRLRTAERILSLETRDLAIFALASLAESRDPEAGSHLERVRAYSRILAQELATSEGHAHLIDAEFIRMIYLTSPLHDIGKVAIPDYVLLKPGRLDDREFEIMKTHAASGAATLERAIQQYPDATFLRMARDIAACHHERWYGAGYPSKLAGKDIPLCARIFSVADVYDALVSKRVYKAAFTHDVARSIIVKGRGSQFDADVVDAFLRHEEEFRTIAQIQTDAPVEQSEVMANA